MTADTTTSDCVSTFQLSKIFDTNVTYEQAEELRLAEESVKAFLQWDLTHETVDVALQVREMLDRVHIEFGPKAGEESDPDQDQDHRDSGNKNRDGMAEVVEIDDSGSESDDGGAE